MAELIDDILDDGDSVGNYDLDIVDEDALLADDFEESSSSKRAIPDDEDFIDMGVEEDLVDIGAEGLDTGNKRIKFDDANDSEGESQERSRFKTERAFPSKRQTNSIPETLDAISVKPTTNHSMINRGGVRGRGIRPSLSARLGAKRGGGGVRMRPPFHPHHPHFNRPPFFPNQFNPPNYSNFPPQPPMFYPPYPHQQGPPPPQPPQPMPPPPPPPQQLPQPTPHPQNQPSQQPIHGPNIHVNPHFRSNINAFWNGSGSWNNNNASSVNSATSNSSQDYSRDWPEQPPPPGSGPYQQGSQYYNNGQEYYMPTQQDPYYQQQSWQGPGNPQGNNWDGNYYNGPNMPPPASQPMIDYPTPAMPMGGPQGPPGLMPPGPSGQRHPRPMGPRQMRPHLNPQIPLNRPPFRNNQTSFPVRPNSPAIPMPLKNKSPVQPKIKPAAPPPVPLNKLKSSSSHRSMEVLRTVVITELPETKSATPSSSIMSISPAITSQPNCQPPAEEEDEELREYRKKIEEQKKLREELLRLKEEKRKVAAQQKSQQLEEGLPTTPQEELKAVRVRTSDNRIIVKQLPASRIEKLKQARLMNLQNKPSTGNGQLTQRNGSGVVASRVALVDNLSASTSQKQLEDLAKTVGPIESVNLDGEAKKAKVKFRSIESAQAFVNKFQRKMIDLSMISVSLVADQ